MRRRGQTTILLLAVLLPVTSVALLGLAFLGARVQGERAQRLADVAALSIALGHQAVVPAGGELDVAAYGAATRVTVTLPPTRLAVAGVGDTGFAAKATAVARSTITADGQPGAVLVG